MLNQSLMDAQPSYDVGASDRMWSALDRQTIGAAMDVDPPAPAPVATPTARETATLANSSASADPLASRYSSNSKDAYRERKRLKEIEEARLEKIRKQEEAARIRKEVEAEKARRAGMTGTTASEPTPTPAAKPVGSSDRQKKLDDLAERQRILKEIEEERKAKFGEEAVSSSDMSISEQRAAFDERQKEKAKEEWKVEHEKDQQRMAELRKQLAEDKEKRMAEREAARVAAEARAKASASTAASAASTTEAQPSATPSNSTSTDPSLPKRSVAEELAEARRARLGITKITGTQAHAGSASFTRDDDDDDENMTIEQIKARNKARAVKAGTSTSPSPATPETPSPTESPASNPPETDVATSLREMHQKRYEEQKRKEQEAAEREARAARAARMISNTNNLSTRTAPSPSSSDPNAAFFQPSAPPARSVLGDIPLETSSGEINEELALISLRLPDGRIKRAGFKARDPIMAVHRYASSWLPRDTVFQLIIPMPRQEFTDDQMESTTLKDAGLAPRGILTVLTLENRGTVRQAPARPADLYRLMGMTNFQGSELEAIEDYANMSYEELMELQERLGYVPTGMTDREIKSIPSQKFVAPEDSTDGVFCVVCQCDIQVGETILTLPKCGHSFHKNCLEPWLRDRRSCPACRQRVFEGSSRRNVDENAMNVNSDTEEDSTSEE